MKFSKDNQPSNRGRKKGKNKVTMSVSVTPETKEYYRQERGLAGRVLEDYVTKKKWSMTVNDILSQVSCEDARIKFIGEKEVFPFWFSDWVLGMYNHINDKEVVLDFEIGFDLVLVEK